MSNNKFTRPSALAESRGCYQLAASTPHEGSIGAEQVTVPTTRVQTDDRETLVRFFKAPGGANWEEKARVIPSPFQADS